MSSFSSPKLNYMGPVVGLIFGSYFLNAISMTTEKINWLGYFSPYYYLDLTSTNGLLETNIFGCLVITVVSGILLWISYKRYLIKDIVN